VLPGFDLRAELDEIEFRRSGLGFAVCGHEIDRQELPVEFPSFLALDGSRHVHAE
jgi:hypothetical protein